MATEAQLRARKNLKRGGTFNGGRKPIAHDAVEFMRVAMTRPDWLERELERIQSGSAPHLETYWHNRIFGRPTEHVELSGPDGAALRLIEVRLAQTP